MADDTQQGGARTTPLWRDANRLLLLIEEAVRFFPRYHNLRRQAMLVCRLVARAFNDAGNRARQVEFLVAAVDDLKIQIQLESNQEDNDMTMIRLIKPLAVGVAAVLLAIGPATAQDNCNPNIPAMAPDSRYTNHGDGTVTDTATGLMWKRCPEGLSRTDCEIGEVQTFTWQEALQRGAGHTFAGHSDWRLPNVKELSSLAEKRCFYPAINLTLFPNTPSDWFWSSSPYANYSNYAWIVYFSYGYVDFDYKGSSLDVRLVRGGQ